MIARKSFLIVASQFISSFIGWIGLVALAKLWGGYAPEAFGTIGFAMSFIALFGIIADLGFSRAHVKRISEGKDLGTCIGTYITIKIILITAMVSIVFLGMLLWRTFFQTQLSDATTESVISVVVIYYVFVNLLQIATTTFEARKEIAKRQITLLSEGIKTPLMILVALAGVHTLGIAPAVKWPEFLGEFQLFLSKHPVGSLAMTYVFAMLLASLVGLWFLRQYPIKKPDWLLFKSYFTFALPLMLFSIIGVISFNIDKIMIGFFWTSTEVGYYFSIQTILAVVAILYTAVGTVLFPTISEYHSSNNIKKIKDTVHLAERYISMIMIPPMVILIVFVNPVIKTLLNTAFLPAAPVLIVLVFYSFIFSLNRSYGSLIRGMDRPNVLVRIGIVVCTSNIILNYLFIPKDGLLSSLGISGPTGAACATTFSVLISFFWIRIAAKKLSNIRLWQTHTPRHILAGLIMAGILYLLAYRTTFFPSIHWYHLIFFALLGLGIYLGILYLFKEFSKKDLNFFLDILRPKEMIQYISTELKEKPPKK